MWIAHYNDGTELAEVSNGREVLFRDIDQNRLVRFELRVNSKSYEVDLINGSFKINTERMSFENFSKANKFELVYFRRVRHDLGPQSIGEQLQLCFGWKTNIDGHSFKRILKISERGDATLALQ
jgi:hypothetical protein